MCLENVYFIDWQWLMWDTIKITFQFEITYESEAFYFMWPLNDD